MDDNEVSNRQALEKSQLDGQPEERVVVAAIIKQYVQLTEAENEDRGKIYKKRRDFFEGKHHNYSNVVGLRGKERQGHILAVFNYIGRMSRRLGQALTNSPIRYKIKPEDEADDIESIRAEAEEKWHGKILRDNHFMDIVFKRNTIIQIRDADFAIKTIVETDERKGKQIKIQWAENMEKLHVIWDDAAGTDFSAVVYRDLWTLEKIAREFNGYKVSGVDNMDAVGTSHKDPYDVAGTSMSNEGRSPAGKNKIPKAWVTDTWGWFKVLDDNGGEPLWKMCNMVLIGDTPVQFVKTDYEYNPWVIGHSFDNPGRPWSISFMDDLIDPQVELNDRTSEEGDMIRIGANQKFIVTNMPDFDATSVKPGSGQVIFIEGEGADFKPLETNVNPFPSDTYINRAMDHLFNLGLPKIALSAGSAPYTGRVGAIQYQAVSDLVDELRMKWSPVLQEMFKRIQDYTIKFFPEAMSFMMAHGDEGDYGPVMREIEFEWDSALPQSQSEAVVDGATLFDRSVLPIKRLLEKAGYQDPNSIIKELKKELKDPELSTIRTQFRQLSEGVVKATNDARRESMNTQDAMGGLAGAMDNSQGQPTPPATKPILQNNMNTGRRGPPATAGVSGVGQTASPEGAVKQVSQNLRAQ
jgi:hypothetical protein